jgi:two-component system response regulator HydG
MKNVLIVDNQISTCDLLSKFLTKKNYEVETATRGQTALELSQRNKFDLVIADYNLPDMGGETLYDELKKYTPKIRMILMGKEVNLKNAVAMIRRGVNNFISKPLNPDELLEAINEAKEGRDGLDTFPAEAAKPSSSGSSLMSGQCSKVKAIMEQVRRVGPTNFSVILQGETGTGKESLAQQIHRLSKRKDGPFVAVDCGCLSKEIAASELFGHEKGAFTGAIAQKTGFFEQANGGTIFLDEIGNLSLDIQMALLRALQEKVIRKIGGSKEIPIDVRIIAASNENLLEKTETINFREDLYFRLCEYTLEIPPLRERTDDIPLFVDFFLEQTSRELSIPKPKISGEVAEYFMEYKWPGNIRELRNVIRRSCLFTDSNNTIQTDALPSRIRNFMQERMLADPTPDDPHADDSPIEEVAQLSEGDLKSTAFKAESRRILEVLEKVRFNKTKAAKILNIHRKTLYMKLKLMDIHY